MKSTPQQEVNMSSEKRKEQYRNSWAKKQAKMQESGITRKIVTLKPNEKILIVRESDPNQTDLENSEKEKEIMAIINAIRAKNKGTVILARQKELAEALQQIEEILGW